MKIRFLGHSCIEIIGYRHIVIDPDFTTEPESGVEYICVTHGHQDHIGRLAEISTGVVIADLPPFFVPLNKLVLGTSWRAESRQLAV